MPVQKRKVLFCLQSVKCFSEGRTEQCGCVYTLLFASRKTCEWLGANLPGAWHSGGMGTLKLELRFPHLAVYLKNAQDVCQDTELKEDK